MGNKVSSTGVTSHVFGSGSDQSNRSSNKEAAELIDQTQGIRQDQSVAPQTRQGNQKVKGGAKIKGGAQTR